MLRRVLMPVPPVSRCQSSGRWDMEVLVGYILLGGVLASVTLLGAGLIWRWAATGSVEFDYSLHGMNVFEFLRADLRQVASGAVRPRLLVNLGIAALLLTPYLRVLASMVFFAAVERNPKYTLFTAFVFSVLTYSLFLR